MESDIFNSDMSFSYLGSLS